MVTKRMLIDTSHPEETRVLVVNKNKLEDFDVEVESRRPLKGNIYLAKVTRVEPSLQAAFVDFGGNRHGFLAFNEIHPDYYQIPVADRNALIAEARADAEAAKAAEEDEADADDGEAVETLGGDDSEEIEARRPANHRRNYKIQEVIKRRQILLIQVVKEERGTKGAALTTFLSLAGRYCVLMPNTDRGGGISRKIGSIADRKRLKSVVNELGIPEGMAVIVRTAGAKRSKAEVRRDYDYLLRLWNQVREMTLNSIAPCLVHEEGNLIKRSIRDIYTKEIDEIIVHGEDGYRMAKDFMKILIPSHAKKVKKYKDEGVPMTNGYSIDEQLSAIHSPEVHMKSGAYIVINPTEALVSIDVNSGRSTKERNIEETALKTNMEAAEEIARQLRLRDLAGLIVIDFIDMEVHRNQSRVERVLKEAMRPDRARIQIGRISPFGLLELSRQRLRPSLIETSSEPCPYCEGTGIRRSTDTTAVEVIRAIEEEGMRKANGQITVFAPTGVALFVLNNKRHSLVDIEEKYGLGVVFENDDTLIPPAIRIEREGEGEVTQKAKRSGPRNADNSEDGGGKRRRRRHGRRRGRRDDVENESEVETDTTEAPETPETASVAIQEPDENTTDSVDTSGEEEKDSGRRRRRGRRGGRRRRKRDEEDAPQASETQAVNNDGTAAPALLEAPDAPELLSPPDAPDIPAIALPDESADSAGAETSAKTGTEAPAAKKPRARRSRKKAPDTDTPEAASAPPPQEPGEAEASQSEDEKPKRRRQRKAVSQEQTSEQTTTPTAEAETDPKPKRRRKTAAQSTKETPPEIFAEKVVETKDDPNTVVVNVGGPPEDKAPPRRGWWRRA